MMDEDWNIILKMLPADWQEQAIATNALKGLRKDKSAENLLRTLLLHLGCGYSLRETVVRAREAKLSDLSDVALLKRLRKSKDWLASLCQSLFKDRGVRLDDKSKFEVRLLDATTVKEPGQTGSLWRIHYSLQIPSLQCDYFKITPTNGEGTGETLSQYSVKPGDHVIADCGYGRATGIEFAYKNQVSILLRITPSHIALLDHAGNKFSIKDKLSKIAKAGTVGVWNVMVPISNNQQVPGRICVIRKSNQAILAAHKRVKDRAARKMQDIKPETFLYAEYVILFTTFDKLKFSAAEILEWYRIRWQVELVFKRFKQLASLGHLPKYTDESSIAWLYGKLFVALLIEKLICQANLISPWGYVINIQTRE